MSPRRWRWWLIYRLANLPNTCWADQVRWADDGEGSPWAPVSRLCRSEPTRSCYCGKLPAAVPSGEETSR